MAGPKTTDPIQCKSNCINTFNCEQCPFCRYVAEITYFFDRCDARHIRMHTRARTHITTSLSCYDPLPYAAIGERGAVCIAYGFIGNECTYYRARADDEMVSPPVQEIPGKNHKLCAASKRQYTSSVALRKFLHIRCVVHFPRCWLLKQWLCLVVDLLIGCHSLTDIATL